MDDRTLAYVTSRVDTGAGPDACHLWTGNVTRNNGYGSLSSHYAQPGQTRQVHRLVLEHHQGPAPEGKPMALHSCDVKACCNPRHLRWGTRLDNADDAVKRGRYERGERRANARLTDDDVRGMRADRAAGATYAAIASAYGVSPWTASRVCRGTKWSHVQ